MGYLDRHLAAGEAVAFRTRLHPVVFASAASFAAFVLGVVVLVIAQNELARSTVALLWLAAVVLVAGSFLAPVLRWRHSAFAVTNRRVLAQAGLFSATLVELPLARTTVRVEQNLWGRLFGYGTLRLAARGGPAEVFPHVGRPGALREAVARHASGASAGRA